MSQGSEFAARLYAAINARDREAIKELTAPDIVVTTTVGRPVDEGLRRREVEELGGNLVVSMRQGGRGKVSGAEVDDHLTHVWTLRDGRGISLQSFSDRDEAVRHARRGAHG